ncbi:Rieske 2Fe-2S domain-containing protein [Paraburkholderia sp. MMS20-SJTR3]|uniref:Rieske 2Fe-2S domain-containing protein n=1 Tax=Paraburkholderia sejongensis TaxID=2886946 RepID=A0ABS8JSN1_9BURK|nr:Rieske 2Fe-2S domain-containing protein [Paraburkholderia sp. MMS20-SJTR3]MCC8392868.1 Rieske 2Fe-2S domain-containing protein [Paraburkholderia sp. MMS20-SJTR3]
MSDTPIARRRSNGQRLNEISNARVNDAKVQSQYQPYKDAAWGFINHWYPALFSHELPEDAVEGIQICGVQIALRRVNGKIYALKDQCIHRGVRLSAKPMCLTKDTISCWYHGFTYELGSGKLTTIAGNPDDKLIGTTGLTTYPVEEVAGMIFVFVREDDYPDEDVPPLAHDLPIRFPENDERFPHPLWPSAPSLLDKDIVAHGMHRTGFANWRIACENGFDNAHILVHKDNAIIHAKDWVLPLGIVPTADDCIAAVEDENGPKGLVQWLFTEKWNPVLENEKVDLKVENVNARPYRTSVFLPGVLMVENWPEEHVVQFEWYVPITDDTYEYWEILARVCPTDKERKDFKYRYDYLFKPLCLHGFNNCDLYAREAMHDFYADGTGWDNEQLVSTDVSPITWRKIASRWNRGIARPGNGIDGTIKASSIRMKRTADGKRPSYFVEKIEEDH